MATDSPTDINPAPPVTELAEAILNGLHADCNCQLCMEQTAKAIAQRLVEQFEIGRRS
jgi:hypothetical protein